MDFNLIDNIDNIDNDNQEQLINIVKELIIKNCKLEKNIAELFEQVEQIQLIQTSNMTISNNNNNSSSSSSSSTSATSAISPEYNFQDLPNKIVIRTEHIESLKDCNMTHIMINILEEMKPPLQLLFFSHKLYIYSSSGTWKECTNEELIIFLNKVHQKFVKEMCEWYSINKEKINATDHASIAYNKMMIKLMGIDFKTKATLSKIKSNLCKYLKALS